MTPPKTTGGRVAAFNTVGAVGFGVQLLALWLLARVVGMPVVLATALAVETAVVHNFICHWCWTWSDRATGGREFLRRFAYFNLTNGAVSLIVNVLLMALLQALLGLNYLVANLVGVVCSAAANFVLGDRVVFADNTPSQRPRARAISSRSAGANGRHRPEVSI